jgi:subtilisin family serine protease
MVRRHLLILFLSLLFLNPYILAAEKETGLGRPLKFRSDLLSRIQKLKTLGPRTKTRKIGPGLNRLVSRKAVTGKSSAVLSPSETANANDKVRIILETLKDLDPDTIKGYGGRFLRQRADLAVVEIPADRIEAMVTDIDDIKYARLPLKFFPTAVTSEGVSLTGAIDYHNAGYTGQGVKVAIIDAGFKGLSDAQNNGDLPSEVYTYDFPSDGIDTVDSKYYHGTACAEIVHDMAPDAELHLLKVLYEDEIYEALDYCMENDIDIISLSLSTFGSGPGDGTGPLDELFDEARADGILVVASAGNYATQYDNSGNSYGGHWEGVFNYSYDDEIHIHEFIPGDPDGIYNVIAAVPEWDDDGNPETDEVTIVMRWNDYWPYADVDYDLYLFDYNYVTGELGEQVKKFSKYLQDGSQYSPPLEYISFDLPDYEDYVHYYALVVAKESDETEERELEIYLGGTGLFVPFALSPSSAIHTPSSSIGEPADAESVLAVGAIDYMNWSTGPQESFSSQGPTNAWAGSDARIKPDICGPDNVTSFTFGSPPDNGFSGTSASAPHVAGAAALILSRYPNLGLDALQSYIEDNAIDMGKPGKDNIYGSGRMHMTFVVDNPEPTNGGVSNNTGGGGGGGGGCFIATAAFGSPMEPRVKILQEFRDSILLTNPAGKTFVALYNRYSPAAAAFISRHDMLRALVRLGLIPMVWISRLILRFGLFEVITVFILFLALSGITLAAVSKKRGIREITP